MSELSAKPVLNYKLRSKDGRWLWQIPVSKGGVPFTVTNLDGVTAHADQYEFHPKFIPVEDSAWIGSLSMAQSFQRILSQRCGIQTDIVERS
jgi:hypothetical protein